MSTDSSELIELLRKMHGLLELLAEDKLAERDARLRKILLEIVGSSVPGQHAVVLMDGTRTQTKIHQETNANRGHLSTLVGKLHAAKLLIGDTKTPKLAIFIPSNFFEKNAQTK